MTSSPTSEPLTPTRTVYVCHPYRGLGRPGERQENQARIAMICRAIAAERVLPVSPIHAMSWLDDTVDEDRALGMRLGLELMALCDEVRVYGRYWESEGCLAEIEAAQVLGKPIRYCAVDNCAAAPSVL